MFESAELGHKLSKEEYAEIEPETSTDLPGRPARPARTQGFRHGDPHQRDRRRRAGETVNLLNEWMDPRHIEVHAFDQPTDEERQRPVLWRFLAGAAGAKGKIGILFGNWYSEPINERSFKLMKKAHLDPASVRFNRFEAMLAAEGVLLIKFWFHLSQGGQKKRLKALEANPDTRWRVREDRLGDLRRTTTATARWPSTCCVARAPASRRG